MNTLCFAVLACLAVLASAKPWADKWDDGRWDDGSWNDGRWDDGRWDDGSWDDGRWDGAWDGGHSNVVVGNGAALVGASAGHAAIVSPSRLGLGLGLGLGGLGVVGVGHGVVVKGPPTVPAKIIGPGRTGVIAADGLWGPTHVTGHGKW